MTIKPIIFSILVTGAIGGLAVGGYSLLKTEESPKPKDLRKLFTDEQITILGSEHNTEWEQLVAKFLADGTDIKKIDIKGIDKDNTGDKKATNIKKLKAACNSLLEKTEDITQNKEIAKNWCTKSSTLLSS